MNIPKVGTNAALNISHQLSDLNEEGKNIYICIYIF